MKLLSIETSSTVCSVAILEDRNVLIEYSIDDQLTHSENLMPLVQKCFEESNHTISDMDAFACDIGPGSFTGIRIGIASVKAFQDVTGKPTIGVSSLLGLAYQCQETGLICVLIDAKNDNCYFGLVSHENENYEMIGEFGCDSIFHICNQLKSEEKTIFFVGNGSIVYQDVLESVLKEKAIIKKDFPTKLTAKDIGMVAFATYSTTCAKPLSPLYLKKSSAERLLEEKENGNSNS